MVEYLAALKGNLESIGGNCGGFIDALEAREKAYRGVLMKPLAAARYGVGCTFAESCGSKDNSYIESAGMGEFVSVVNHVGNLVTRYKAV